MNRMPLTRLDLDCLSRMVRFSPCGPSSKPRPRHFARQCHLEAIKCPVRFLDELQVLFSPLEEQQGFRTCEIGFNEGSNTPLECSKIPPPSRPPFPPPSPPTSKSWPEYRSSWAPARSSRVALKSFPRSSRFPLTAVGRWRKGGRWPPPLCLLNFVTPRM